MTPQHHTQLCFTTTIVETTSREISLTMTLITTATTNEPVTIVIVVVIYRYSRKAKNSKNTVDCIPIICT